MIYRLQSNAMVFAPGFFKWAMACDCQTWNNEAKDIAARMYAMAGAFPSLPAGVLLALADKTLTPTVEDDVLVIDDDTLRVGS